MTKCRAGFTDADLKKLPKMVNKRIISKKNPRVNSILEADVWFKPFIVLEVLGVEVTLSPIHTYAMGSIRKKSGSLYVFHDSQETTELTNRLKMPRLQGEFLKCTPGN